MIIHYLKVAFRNLLSRPLKYPFPANSQYING